MAAILQTTFWKAFLSPTTKLERDKELVSIPPPVCPIVQSAVYFIQLIKKMKDDRNTAVNILVLVVSSHLRLIFYQMSVLR